MPMDEMKNTLYKMIIERNFMHVKIDATKKKTKINANMHSHLMHSQIDNLNSTTTQIVGNIIKSKA